MKKESPSHMDTFLHGPLWEEHVIQHQVKVMNGLHGVFPSQHVNSQLDARHTVKTSNDPFKAKANHVVKVIGSHRHLPLGNMKGVGNVPPPLNEALRQGGTRRLFRKKTDDRLKAHLSDIAPSFEGKQVEPLHHLIDASPTSIRGR